MGDAVPLQTIVTMSCGVLTTAVAPETNPTTALIGAMLRGNVALRRPASAEIGTSSGCGGSYGATELDAGGSTQD